MAYAVNPSLQRLTKAEKEAWNDARGRAAFAKLLITDQVPGTLDRMTEATYPGQAGQHPDFGEEVLVVARSL